MSTLEQINELTLDLSAVPGDRSKLTVYAKQEDSVRRVLITLQQNGEAYTIPTDVEVMLRALKPDGRYVLANCNASGSNVYLSLPREALTRAGSVRAEICLMQGTDILTSTTFYVEVIPSALSEVASSNDLSALSKALETSNALLNQAYIPVAVETVWIADGFVPGSTTGLQYSVEPVWKDLEFVSETSGSTYSNYHAAFDEGYVYFFDSTDHTYFCKLIGENASCTGYVKYRLLGAKDGLSEELRLLLNGDEVEGRALPTANEAAKLSELISDQSINVNSTTYHLLENTLFAITEIWAQYFYSTLAYGNSVDFGTGKHLRFTSDEEMAELNQRITALGG